MNETAVTAAPDLAVEQLGPLDVDECLALLQQASLGRLVFVDDYGPLALPVHYALLAGVIAMRTAAGSKFDAALQRPLVAFEVDGVGDGHAWSVVVRGRLEEMWRPEEIVQAESLLGPASAGRSHFLRVVPGRISGRRGSLRRS